LDKVAIDAARTEYTRAAESLAAVATTNDFPTLERHWASFLVSAGRVFTKLEQGAKVRSKSNAWWGSKVHQRRTDPLLCYLWHARNADEHTLQRINRLQPAQANVIEPTKEEIAQLERAMKNQTRPWAALDMVEWTPEDVLLLPVVDRRVRYDPPKEHLGKAIESSSPAHIGGLALAYLDGMLKEAEALCC
jgi:hypothetical protein